MPWQKPPREEIDGEYRTVSPPYTSTYKIYNADLERLGNPGWNWDNYHKYCHKVEK